MSQNFKGEDYPADISVVLADMQRYVAEIDRQLYGPNPFYVKDFILSGADTGNSVNRDLFLQHFKTYNSDNTRYKNKDFKGVYVFAKEHAGKIEVRNIGISKTIMRRFYQHVCGKLHNQSTLAFYMALQRHEDAGHGKYENERSRFPYNDYRGDCQDEIKEYRFAIVPINNNFELYMAEVYLACHYKAYWNTFETH